MTQLTLNIEDNEMLGVLKKLIKNLKGVSIAYANEEIPSQEVMEAFEDIEKGRVSESFSTVEDLITYLHQ